MADTDKPIVVPYRGDDGTAHVRVDRPGTVAESASLGDAESALAFIIAVADAADLEVDDTADVDGAGPITITIPPGA